MSTKHIDIQAAMSYPMAEVVFHYGKQHKIDRKSAELHERELKRFLILCATADHPPPLVGLIDKIWHTFILDTKKYKDFCENFLGQFIHHVPQNRPAPLSLDTIRKFSDDYKKVFGEHPDDRVWITEAKLEEARAWMGNKMNRLVAFLADDGTTSSSIDQTGCAPDYNAPGSTGGTGD